MTKKELLENEAFKALPDDAQIVLGTSMKPMNCQPLTTDHITYVSEFDGLVDNEIRHELEPIFKHYLIITNRF